MPTQTLIANWALLLIGEKRLSDLSDDNENAEIIADFWDAVRDNLLIANDWTFAIVRDALAADSATPTFGFNYQYSLPANVLRVIAVGEVYPGPDLNDYRTAPDVAYRIEGRKILTDWAAPLSCRWVVSDTDVSDWHASFAKLMACDLAELVNPRASESEAIAQRIARTRYDAWALAGATNAIENPPEAPADDSFIAAFMA